MKKVNKFLLVLVLMCLVAFGISCASNDDSGSDEGGSGDSPVVVQYTVKFKNSDLSDVKINAGEKLNKPADPTKTNHIFGGWYLDSSFNNEVSFPMTINKDTEIYAYFYDYQTAFKKARNKTIGDDVNEYQYDYTINASVAYGTYSLSGQTTGNSKYSKNSDVSFYDEHTNSGILFYDGTKYQIKKDTTLQKISLDEDGIVTKFTSELVDANYKFDSSSFAKALFEYSDDQLKSIEKTTVANEYKLNTSFSASNGMALVGNYLNHPIVEKILGELPETSVDTGMYVTFDGGEIKSYRYEMNVNVSSITFSLTYKLTFKALDKNYNIVPKSFAGLSISSNDISNYKQTINQVLNAYKNTEKTSYDFEVETGVDYGTSTGEINSTFKGSAIRKTSAGTVYFHNDIEVDSDFKNADLYKDAGIEDIHTKKTKLSTGEVYNIEKKLLKDATFLVDNYVSNESDSYYLYKVFSLLSNITYIQTVVDTKDNEVEYSIGLSKEDVVALLNYLNSELNLDPLSRATKSVKVFGTFDANTIEVKDAEFVITVVGGVLEEIEIEVNGTFNTKFEGSRDFTVSKQAAFDFDLSIEVTDDASKYEPYETVKDAK